MDEGAVPNGERALPYSAGRLARTFFAAGSQSLGGGPSTLYLMRLYLVERFHWVTAREFLEDWALSRVSPGIHLVANAGLLGRRVDGLRGVAVATASLVVPAAIIATFITAGYDLVRDQPLVRAALAGIEPVTLGLTVGMNLTLVRATVRRGRRAGVDWLAYALAALAGLVFPSATVMIILAGFVGGALFLGHEPPRADPEDGR
ncbi:MAG: chromate transporter [Candidatus Limnocylindria bacterium]|nr:chromate transporter [Candidatus Limnocylindria bacterium]